MLIIVLSLFGVFGDKQGTKITLQSNSILVAVPSRVEDAQIRSDIRNKCRGLNDVRFFIALPADNEYGIHDHKQGYIYSAKSRKIMKMVMREQLKHNDVFVCPHKETYRNLPLKSLTMIRYAYDKGYDYIVKIDDEFCVNELALQSLREKWLYAGEYMFRGNEYTSMRGADNQYHPYFSGNVWILSRALMKCIVVDNYVRSLSYYAYGSSSEDVDVGYWVHQCSKSAVVKTIHNLKNNRKHVI